jgi:F-type H+-transporting ATPase subunit delta
MDQGRVSVSYARALLAWANSKKLAGEVYVQSKNLFHFIENHPEFTQLLSSPVVPTSKKQKICSSLLTEFAPHLTKLVVLTIKNGRENNLPFIMLQYQKLYRNQHGVARVEIESASELSSDIIGGIKGYLEQNLGKSIEIEHHIAPDLVGGFRLIIDDRLMDKSVKGELDLLHRKLLGIYKH